MTRQSEPLQSDTPRKTGYLAATKTATYSYLAAVPLVLLYEWLIIVSNAQRDQAVRVGADVWLKNILASIGIGGHIALGVLLLVIGAVIFIIDRRHATKLKARYFIGMFFESLVYGIVIALIISRVVNYVFAAQVQVSPPTLSASPINDGGLMLQIALSLGAGLYEELFFRLLLVTMVYYCLKPVIAQKRTCYVVAALLAALCFSWVHYIGTFGDPFTVSSFTYRFLFGLALNALFLLRGFGIAAWTHALYDVMVVTTS